ncbi:Uncharacterized protein OBRU01_02552 [Operophtera brumata]|uniref:Uncharacterized protein n=1 Tax=Operophtera brumata TaxID=104452 RepID=A0A0L7LEY3_OPEBR|nr:Uncharacterized protein OBRU01_02552 [Operophtera brumata]
MPLALTRVSEGLVSKIVKEGKVAEQTGTKVRTPGKSRKRSTGFIVVDDFDMGVIQRKALVIRKMESTVTIDFNTDDSDDSNNRTPTKKPKIRYEQKYSVAWEKNYSWMKKKC